MPHGLLPPCLLAPFAPAMSMMVLSTRACQAGILGRNVRSFSVRSRSLDVTETRDRVKSRIAEIDSARPYELSPALVDTFSRRHDYLRISLTERCNLRCFYCMPSEGVELSPSQNILSNEEVLRLATLFVKSGVTKIRLTGGEPTIRKGIADIISGLNELKPYGLKSIAMTTNGLALHRRLPMFIENGLTHLNLSLDTLDPFKFEIMTRRPGHAAVMSTLHTALSSPELKSVKLNVVIVRGLNDNEVLDFAEMTRDIPLSVRFIEFMPFTGNKWDKAKMVPSSDLLERLRAKHPGIERISDEANDTARSWRIPGYQGSIGFISSMSDHFCSTCNRLRITADGQIKVCLFDAKEISLRDTMRRGATDAELLQIIGRAVSGKAEKHVPSEDIDVVTNRPMILIGGTSPRSKLRQSSMYAARNGILPWLYSMRPGAESARLYSTANSQQPRLSHVDESGHASMVDVSPKKVTKRTATAVGRIYVPPIAYEFVTRSYPSSEGSSSFEVDKAVEKAKRKGDALTVAQLAGIMGAKKTSDMIPLCHSLALSNISVTLTPRQPDDRNGRHSIHCKATVTCVGKTGVEMEALTAVSTALLTVWDMLKAVAGKQMEISRIYVSSKSGGKSGDFDKRIEE